MQQQSYEISVMTNRIKLRFLHVRKQETDKNHCEIHRWKNYHHCSQKIRDLLTNLREKVSIVFTDTRSLTSLI